MRSRSCWRPYHADIAAGRSACLSTEGLCGCPRTSHHHTRQLVAADRKVSSTLQISAGAAAAEEGGARQIVASQSTTGRYLTYPQSPRCSRDLYRHVCVPTSPTPRTSASGSRPTEKDIRSRQRCSMSLTASTLRLTTKKSHCLLASTCPHSAASDTVCHSTLTQRLHTGFGVSGTALSWIQSYLQDWTQFVKLGQHQSSETNLEVGVPQGSVLSLLLFAVYCSPVEANRKRIFLFRPKKVLKKQFHFRAENEK